MAGSAVQIGFGRASLWGSWQTDRSLEDEIEVRGLAVVGPDGPAAVLAADVCGMWPSTCLRLRQAVAAALGADPGRVGIFCTQNHGAPMEGPQVYDLDQWEQAFVRAATQARAAARPAQMALVEVHPAPAGLVNRRKPFRDMGSFTFWYGFELLPGGRAGCRGLLELALRGLASGPELTVRHAPRDDAGSWPAPHLALPEVPADAVLDGPVDSRLQGLFFRTPGGEPIGSLARWPAHPITANVPDRGHSGDYPAYVRRQLEGKFGGGALFLTGPCGDQAPLVARKSRALAEETGARVAGWLLQGLETASWEEVAQARAGSLEVVLPLRHDYPSTLEAARVGLEEARQRFRDAADLGERKRWSEEVERLLYSAEGHHYSWCGFRVEESGGRVRHPLFALRLGAAVVVGLPGEPFGSYSLKLREAFPGVPLLVVEECNGYLSYIPGPGEYPQGGYGAAAAILDPRAEEMLLAAGRSLVDRVRGG